MKGDEFRAKYRLLKRLTRRGVRSYNACDMAGRPVMVHVIGLARPNAERLLSLLERLDAGHAVQVIETLDVEGTPVVVTQVIERFASLPVWLKSCLSAGAPAAGGKEAKSASEPGEFTRLFGRALRGKKAREEAGEGAKAGPGAGASEPRKRKPVVRWRERQAREGTPAEPGKPVVRWKGKKSAAAPSGPALPPEPVLPPGPAVPSQPAVPEARPGEPGEFTRLFRQESAEPRAPLGDARPAARPPLDFEVTDYRKKLHASAPEGEALAGAAPVAPLPPPSVVPPREMPPAGARAKAGPSEFTLIVSGGRGSPSPESPRGGSAGPESDFAAPPRAGPRPWVLVAGLGFVLVAIVSLILYFALK
jgi:hypothetical protein